MSATTNPNKNIYGGRKRRRKNKVPKAIKSEIDRRIAAHDAKEIELKYHDTWLQAQSIGYDTSAYVGILSNMSRGTTSNTRIGTVIKVVGNQIRFSVHAADSTNFVRVILFRWFNPGVSPTTTTVLQADPTTSKVLPWNPIYRDVRKSMHVVYDNLFNIHTYVPQQVDKVYLKNHMNMSFNENDTPDDGHLYIYAVSDSVIASHPTITFYNRLKYQDA